MKYQKSSRRLRSYYTPVNEISDLRWEETGPEFIHKARARQTGAQLGGQLYEQYVHGRLSERYGERYLAGPWLSFREEGVYERMYAQPDGLILSLATGRITIVEVKIKHTSRSWYQLRNFYEPLVSHFFDGWAISVCEVFKWDSRIKFPEHFKYVADPHTEEVPDEVFRVHKVR